MRTYITIFLLLLQGTVRAQYYYQDIYNTDRTAATMAQFKANKVSFQHVKTLDANQQTDNDFICVRGANPTFRQLRAVTQSRSSGRSVLTSTFAASGRLTRTIDSSVNSISTMQYRYTPSGELAEIEAVARGREDKFRSTEKRRYEYDSAGRLQRLVITKGGPDSTVVLFKTDSSGRVTEEAAPGRQRVYYNYNAQGRLTDVLRYHPSRKRMLPDYSFEYDAQGRLAQMTVVNLQTGDYLIWQYRYDEKGLPERENCYGKGKELLGMVRYTYEFFQ